MCDILLMDACHILLGKPWQFDREMVYDGRTNSILFKKGGKNFEIQSLLEEEGTQEKVPKVLLCGEKEILRELKQTEN